MVSFSNRAIHLLAFLTLLPSLTLSATSSPLLALAPTLDCLKGVPHRGTPQGKNVTIAGVNTYVAEPPKGHDEGPKKVIFFFSDVFSAVWINNMLIQDYFATQGYHVLGLDYFFGDPIQNHTDFDLVPFDPDFDFDEWIAKSRQQAAAALPSWIDAVRRRYGQNARYHTAGYCFGAKYVMEISTTDQVVAGSFSHPFELTEDHFNQIKKPLLMNCAERDASFPAPNLYRAVDILTSRNASYHTQIYSGTQHGFATRANLSDENAAWAAADAAKSIIRWFDRFSP
ncbi:alpha/beta-hydrolase [Coprinellus micaceus]|uniref:Alpha/beta-hydrolase n=1 Tax=Coprinellus micaceus TaxID=71717 RepID=A0A4Y7SKH5_COPMI|nr:alpha/beta-hydrolase [Coprinellus micaceus]